MKDIPSLVFKIMVPVFLSLLTSSCYYFQKVTNPIKTQEFQSGGSNNRLIILLPGIGDRASVFEKYGVVTFINENFPDTKIIAVDAHFKYYQQRSVVDRIHQDIVLPAIEAGFENIYIGGTSLGGLGSLLYFQYHPEILKGLIVIAPYLGEENEFTYLLEGTKPDIDSFEIKLWPWITQLSLSDREKIYLAYGEQDKFAIPNRLLGTYLPEENTITSDGKHKWSTWEKLWPKALDALLKSK